MTTPRQNPQSGPCDPSPWNSPLPFQCGWSCDHSKLSPLLSSYMAKGSGPGVVTHDFQDRLSWAGARSQGSWRRGGHGLLLLRRQKRPHRKDGPPGAVSGFGQQPAGRRGPQSSIREEPSATRLSDPGSKDCPDPCPASALTLALKTPRREPVQAHLASVPQSCEVTHGCRRSRTLHLGQCVTQQWKRDSQTWPICSKSV